MASQGTKRSRKSGSSSAVSDKQRRSIGHEKARASASGKRLLSERIQSEREQLFKAISIVECCKYASASYAEVGTMEYMEGVFEVLIEILDSAAGELGVIIEDIGRHSKEGVRDESPQI